MNRNCYYVINLFKFCVYQPPVINSDLDVRLSRITNFHRENTLLIVMFSLCSVPITLLSKLLHAFYKLGNKVSLAISFFHVELTIFFAFPGWGYDEVLEYFKKSEDNEDKEVYHKNPEYHGKGGYQTVEWLPYHDQNLPVLIQAWKEKGYPERDLNAENQVRMFSIINNLAIPRKAVLTET